MSRPERNYLPVVPDALETEEFLPIVIEDGRELGRRERVDICSTYERALADAEQFAERCKPLRAGHRLCAGTAPSGRPMGADRPMSSEYRLPAELVHLFRELKAPAAARTFGKLAERARAEEWSYERFVEALLSTEVSSRESSGGRLRIRAARFPAHKTLEEFDFTFQRSVKKQVIEHLGQLDFLHAKDNVILLGPPGTGKTHLAIALGIRACLAGQRVLFRTATEWVAALGDAQRQARLDDELHRLERIPLLVCDEVGYIPFDPQAASLMFMLVSRRYERASLIVTSNKPFSKAHRFE